MIGEDRRKAIYHLHQEGMGAREIARRLRVARNTVRAIIEQEGKAPAPVRPARVALDPESLRRLYEECGGWVQRVHEKLADSGRKVAYATLTRRLRELGISVAPSQRCAEVPDRPGVEMQHDTSPYTVEIGGKKQRVIASVLYLRFSKRRYLKFYPAFNRFRLKCFLHEALLHWRHAAPVCVIDNTNLARLRGTGKNAVIVPEMESFAGRYGFKFICHEINHPDRKAGEERSFWTVETNFFPGRTFASWADLNRQAREWACERMENRRQGKTRVVPATAFAEERPFLREIPAHLPAPYVEHLRGVDQYGYAPFNGNFYHVPGSGRGEVKLLEYAEAIRIYHERVLLAEYPLPTAEVKNEKFAPAGAAQPRGAPAGRRGSEPEEKRLRALGEDVGAYLDFALQEKGRSRPEFMRQLLGLARRMTPELFKKSVARALTYRITAIATIERIAQIYFNERELPQVDVDATFRDRKTYRDGSITDPPDLTIYG